MRDINPDTITKAALEHPLDTHNGKPAGCTQGTVSGPFEVEGDKAQARSVLKPEAGGLYYSRTIVSDSFENTADGTVGELLHTVLCHPWWPAHLHFVIEAVSYKKHDRRCVPQRRPALRFRRCRGVRESAAGDGLPKPDGNYTLHFEFVVNPGK